MSYYSSAGQSPHSRQPQNFMAGFRQWLTGSGASVESQYEWIGKNDIQNPFQHFANSQQQKTLPPYIGPDRPDYEPHKVIFNPLKFDTNFHSH